MRLALAICFCFTLPGLAYSQVGNDPEHVIKQIIETGFLDGHDRKVIGRLGDAGAVVATKILAGRELTPNTIDSTLLVMGESFADPGSVVTPEDRQPRTALLLLKYLDLSTSDAALKQDVADTVKYVQDRYAASLAATRR